MPAVGCPKADWRQVWSRELLIMIVGGYMEPVLWKDKYCIGIEEIDKQHMDFVKLINRFMVLFGSGGHINLQDRVLLEILKYAEYHFVSEENIMIFYNYPDHATQKEAHDVLVRLLKRKSFGLKMGSVNGSDLIRFLINWFMHHTQEEDRKLAQYILDKENR